MGLDMYLRRKVYVGNKWKKPEELVTLNVPAGAQDNDAKIIKPERISEITEEVAYWRKANQIHAWFVKNVQKGEDDCGDYYVSREQLTELRDLCKRVIEGSKLVKGKIENGQRMTSKGWEPILEDGEYIEDARLAEELLPTESGFFFGGTNYDQYYLYDLTHTVEMLDAILAEPEMCGEFYYHSSW